MRRAWLYVHRGTSSSLPAERCAVESVWVYVLTWQYIFSQMRGIEFSFANVSLLLRDKPRESSAWVPWKLITRQLSSKVQVWNLIIFIEKVAKHRADHLLSLPWHSGVSVTLLARKNKLSITSERFSFLEFQVFSVDCSVQVITEWDVCESVNKLENI